MTTHSRRFLLGALLAAAVSLLAGCTSEREENGVKIERSYFGG